MNRRIRKRLGLISAGLAAVGGAAAAIARSQNALRPPPLNHLGGVQCRISYLGNELFVTELGSGPPIVLIHGIYAGASSYEFRRIAPLLAMSHRVIAFDFLGCGLSDHPDCNYTAELFVDQIVHILSQCTDTPAVLLASSYGAAYAIRAAAQVSDRVAACVAISPAGLAQDNAKQPSWQQIFQLALRTPALGSSAYAALTSAASIRWYLRRIYADERMITPELIEHYVATSHVDGASYVVAAFVGGTLECELASELPFLQTPILVLRGNGPHIGRDDTDTIIALGNKIDCITFDDCGALPHEELPQATTEAISTFLSRQ